jgi:hypothetical protein
MDTNRDREWTRKKANRRFTQMRAARTKTGGQKEKNSRDRRRQGYVGQEGTQRTQKRPRISAN